MRRARSARRASVRSTLLASPPPVQAAPDAIVAAISAAAATAGPSSSASGFPAWLSSPSKLRALESLVKDRISAVPSAPPGGGFPANVDGGAAGSLFSVAAAGTASGLGAVATEGGRVHHPPAPVTADLLKSLGLKTVYASPAEAEAEWSAFGLRTGFNGTIRRTKGCGATILWRGSSAVAAGPSTDAALAGSSEAAPADDGHASAVEAKKVPNTGSVYFVCGRGSTGAIPASKGEGIRNTSTTQAECRVAFTIVKHAKSSEWLVSLKGCHLEHSHELVAPDISQFLSSNRFIPDDLLATLANCAAGTMSIREIHELLRLEAAKKKIKVSWLLKDIDNRVTAIRSSERGSDGDAAALVQMLEELKVTGGKEVWGGRGSVCRVDWGRKAPSPTPLDVSGLRQFIFCLPPPSSIRPRTSGAVFSRPCSFRSS